jgi:2-dehydropantoate 2-reductase
MRIVVLGVGAIGGVIAARLAATGQDVAGIARGRQLEAITANGLLLRTPDGEERVRFTCAATPAGIDWRPDDAVFLTVKSQDTLAALHDLRDAGVHEQPIFCAQNGVANEDMALRYFPNVYGTMVAMPADYLTPGEVNVFSAPVHGIFDIGRYSGGTDAVTACVAAALGKAGIVVGEHADVMRSKYAKLLMNLGNIIGAAFADEAVARRYSDAARAEGAAVLKAAGIAHDEHAGIHRDLLKSRGIPGIERAGSSSLQSLARGAGSIETDYLNGEIVLIARRHGIEAPVNAWFARLGHRMLIEGMAPGSVDPAEAARALPGI